LLANGWNGYVTDSFLSQPFSFSGPVAKAPLQFTFNIVGGPYPGDLPMTFDVRLVDPQDKVVAILYTDSISGPLPSRPQTVTVDIASALNSAGSGSYKLQFHGHAPGDPMSSALLVVDDISLFLNGNAPPVPAVFSGLTLNQSAITEGTSTQATVTLASPAGDSVDSAGNDAGGVYVQLSSDVSQISFGGNAQYINGIPFVLVPQGATTATFDVNAGVVASATTAHIYASLQNGSASAALAIAPHITSSLTLLNPASAVAGLSAITLNLYGTGFSASSVVNFGGLVLTPSTVTGKMLTVTVPVSPLHTPGPVQVIVSDTTTGGTSNALPFTISANTVTGVALSSTAPVGGAPVSMIVVIAGKAGPSGVNIALSSSDGKSIPPGTSIAVPYGMTRASYVFTPSPVDTATPVTITAITGTVSKSATLTAQPPVLQSLATPAFATGGAPSVVTVTLSGKAGSKGIAVALSSSDGVTIAPGTVLTVPPGASSASLKITPPVVAADTSLTITATQGTVTKSVVLPVRAPVLSALIVSPSSVTSGSAVVVQVRLTGPAPAGGLTVALSSDSSAISASALTVPAGALTGMLVVTAAGVDSSTLVTITGTTGSVTKTVSVTVNPASLQSLSAPAFVTGGVLSAVTVSLNGKAGPSGVAVALSSSDGVSIAPGTVLTVPSGATSAAFKFTPPAVAANTSITITATQGAVTKSAVLPVRAPVPALLIASPTTVKGGQSLVLTVRLNGPAPAGGVSVAITGNASAVPPATIVIPAGGTTAASVVKTLSVGTATPVTLTAALNGGSVTANVTVAP
jgi:hypothetical protein